MIPTPAPPYACAVKQAIVSILSMVQGDGNDAPKQSEVEEMEHQIIENGLMIEWVQVCFVWLVVVTALFVWWRRL